MNPGIMGEVIEDTVCSSGKNGVLKQLLGYLWARERITTGKCQSLSKSFIWRC
jgi:hypothetical protein